jgi:glycosyltransferase involved in cell wall biosynthesis
VNRLVYSAAHLGYDTSRVPVGGGARVALELIRRWAGAIPLTVLGSGPDFPPHAEVSYHVIPWRVPSEKRHVTELSVREYASFSRQFERGVTDYLAGIDPEGVVVLHNDIAEAGDFAAIRRLGFRQAAIFHVDVVDYVANIYLRGLVPAPALARAWRLVSRVGLAKVLPDIARLMFGKQEACARHCQLLVVPSGGMKEVLLSSYPWLPEERVLVVPWGAVVGRRPSEGELAELRARYGIRPGEPVIVTLSRISPEKGQDLLLRALAIWERRERSPLTVFICGEAAFMHGARYLARLRRLARRLRRVRVFFPGYVAGPEKAAFLGIADLYVFPSRHESYGLTMLEAMAAGLPVLTTPHRSARDLVRSEFGRIVPATPRGIYQGLSELLSDPGRLPEMGKAARDFALAISFDRAAARLAEVLFSL